MSLSFFEKPRKAVWAVAVYTCLLFAAAMGCNGELVRVGRAGPVTAALGDNGGAGPPVERARSVLWVALLHDDGVQKRRARQPRQQRVVLEDHAPVGSRAADGLSLETDLAGIRLDRLPLVDESKKLEVEIVMPPPYERPDGVRTLDGSGFNWEAMRSATAESTRKF